MSRFKKRSANTTISITAAIFAQKQILKTPLWCGGGNHSMTKYEFLFFGRSEEKGEEEEGGVSKIPLYSYI